MDQKKLLQIIQKDLQELNELTKELADSNNISKLEIEIAFSKSKLVMQEYELLKERFVPVSPKTELPKSPEVSAFTEEKKHLKDNTMPGNQVEEEINIKESNEPINDPQSTEETEHVIKENPIDDVSVNGNEKPTQEIINEPETIQPKEAEEKAEEVQETQQVETTEDEADDFEDEKTEEDEETIKIVGERFVKEKSLNDMMSESKTLDQQFATSSIDKIESAIGLNDRFQYIRELFDGDADLFKSTVQQLDQMSDIKQAVSHLSTNFKWKKNETSLKFVQLVKRRFLS